MQKKTRETKDKLLEELVIDVKSVVKVNKGGRQRRFSATVVVGDRKGKVGLGVGKANEVPDAIKKAIQTANLGFNPLNDGDLIRIPIAPLTEQTRKELVKESKKYAENCKVAIRNIRREQMEALKKLEKDGVSEDEVKRASDKVQKVTDDFITKVDQLAKAKESDIMSI